MYGVFREKTRIFQEAPNPWWARFRLNSLSEIKNLNGLWFFVIAYRMDHYEAILSKIKKMARFFRKMAFFSSVIYNKKSYCLYDLTEVHDNQTCNILKFESNRPIRFFKIVPMQKNIVSRKTRLKFS